MSVGQNIKKYRIANNMSQQKLADLMGYKVKSTIFLIENDRLQLTSPKLKQMAQIFKVPVSALLEETKEEQRDNEILRIFACLKKCDDATLEVVKRIIGFTNWQNKAAKDDKDIRVNENK